MPTFRAVEHSEDPSRAACEVLDEDGELIAVIYCTDNHNHTELRIMSEIIVADSCRIDEDVVSVFLQRDEE